MQRNTPRLGYADAVTYKPISETYQLPPEGFLPEDLRFDMKMELKERLDQKSVEQRIEELACDIAAFANTAGGVLLIGAHEHPQDSGKLHAYKLMTQSDAMAVCNVAKRALELCSPKPIIDPKVIASGEPMQVHWMCPRCHGTRAAVPHAEAGCGGPALRRLSRSRRSRPAGARPSRAALRAASGQRILGVDARL